MLGVIQTWLRNVASRMAGAQDSRTRGTRSQLQQQQQQWQADRRIGMISIAMWIGTAMRVLPFLTFWENMQSVVAISTMYLLVIVWPTYASESYLKWRTPTVSFLRVFLVALPFNFNTAVFDAIAPNVGTGGRFAGLNIGFQAFLAVRIALLTFTSLGWRVPFRLHLLLQSINVGLLIVYGLHPYCQSKLMRSAEMQATAAAVHKAMGLAASVFLPNVAVSMSRGPYAQVVSFLLFCWAILGWLVPTLLLLPQTGTAARAAPHRQFWLWQLLTVPFGKIMTGLERGLNVLLLPWLQQSDRLRQQQQQQAEGAGGGDDAVGQEGDDLLPVAASFLLAWCIVLLTAWLCACLMAQALMPGHERHDGVWQAASLAAAAAPLADASPVASS